MDSGLYIICTTESSYSGMAEKEFLQAAASGDCDTCEMLIATGCEVNAPNLKGQTALFFAAAKGQLEVSSVLCPEHQTGRHGSRSVYVWRGVPTAVFVQ